MNKLTLDCNVNKTPLSLICNVFGLSAQAGTHSLDATECLYSFKDHQKDVTSLAVLTSSRKTSTGRTLIASGSADFTVRVWDIAVDGPKYELVGHMGSITCLCMFEYGNTVGLYTGSTDTSVRYVGATSMYT
jgi:WD40 repeat protein